MKLENQVLSIEQVRELQELGFDFNKHASMCWAKLFDLNNFYRILNKEYAEYMELNDYTSTLSIGDIIEILPKEIEENELNIFVFGETWSVGWEGIRYYGSNTLIDALFKTLKWCIKQKHIEL